MKKILLLFTSMTLIATPLNIVTSCGTKNDYNGLFGDENEKNDGSYIKESSKKVVDKFNAESSKLFTVNSKVEGVSEAGLKATLLEELKEKIILEDNKFHLEIVEDNSFTKPIMKGYEANGTTKKEIKIEYGKARVNLYYLDTLLKTNSIQWSTGYFDIYMSMINLINGNSLETVGNYNSAKVDLAIFSFNIGGSVTKITLGTLYSFIELLDRLSSFEIPLVDEIMKPIKSISNMNLNNLTEVDPSSLAGKNKYESFENEFKDHLKQFVKKLGDLLISFGLPEEIEIPNIKGDNKTKVKIKDLLNINLIDTLGLDLSSLGNEDMKLEIGNTNGKNNLSLMNVLISAAPNMCELLKYLFSTDNYKKSHSFVYNMISYFFNDMSDALKLINKKNNEDNLSVSRAKTNIDSLLFNALIGFNKNKRGVNGNWYLKLEFWYTVEVAGRNRMINDYLDNLLNKILLNPTNIALNIFNSIITPKKSGATNIEDSILSPNMNVNFIEDVDAIKLIDESDLSDFIKGIIKPFAGTIREKVLSTANEALNKIIPELKMSTLLNKSLKQILVSLGVPQTDLDNSKVELLKGEYSFLFYSKENENWVPTNYGLSTSDFQKYNSFKLKFRNCQFKVSYMIDGEVSYTTMTKDDITFDLIFSDEDGKK